VKDDRIRAVVRGMWIVLIAAAVADALRNDRRSGEVFGLVPYDFRLPSLDRTRLHTWNPSSSRILTPTTFGVGWTLNLGRLARIIGFV
jgi:Family of unknown function (DUF5808)